MTQRRIYQCAFPYHITFNVLKREWFFENTLMAAWLHAVILNAGKMKNHTIYQFAIMPNHVHVLCRMDVDDPHRIQPRRVGFSRLNAGGQATCEAGIGLLNVPHRGLENPRCGTGKMVCTCGERHAYNISDFVKSIRGTFSRQINMGQLWQPRFHDEIIQTDEQLYKIIEYIEQNPIKAELPEKYQEYPYQYKNDDLIEKLFR